MMNSYELPIESNALQGNLNSSTKLSLIVSDYVKRKELPSAEHTVIKSPYDKTNENTELFNKTDDLNRFFLFKLARKGNFTDLTSFFSLEPRNYPTNEEKAKLMCLYKGLILDSKPNSI